MRSWHVADLEIRIAHRDNLNDLRLRWKVWSCLGSFIIVIRFLQSVSNIWQVECWNMLSIVYFSAFSSECNVVSRLLKFCVPISWIFPVLSFQIHPMPLNWSMDVHEPSTIQILSKLKTCVSSTIGACGGSRYRIVLFC